MNSVGSVTPAVEMKLVAFEEGGYLTSSNPPRGEIWVRGASITKGYFKQDKVTAETITADGWLQTGLRHLNRR